MSQPSSPSDAGYRTLLTLAWPVVVARASQAVIGFADAFMSAPLGDAPLAAVTTGSMNVSMLAILPMGLVFIGQSFAAQLGSLGRLTVAVRYAWYGLIVATLVMLVAAVSLPLIAPTLGLLGYDPEVHRLMSEYIQIRLLAAGAIVGTESLGNWYGGLGNTRLQMLAGLLAMVSNVVLNYLLIEDHLGFPALGVQGAALASLVATWLGFTLLLYAFLRRIGFGAVSVWPRALRLQELGRMLRFGLPHGLNWFLEFSAFALFINVVVAGLGTHVLAAMMVVLSINSVSFMPAFGLTSAGAILTGQAIGRGHHDAVGRIVGRTLRLTLGWQGSVGLVYLLLPATLMRLFATHGGGSEAMVETGTVLLALSAAWQLFDATGMTLGEMLRSAGDTAWTLGARLVIAWLVFVPSAFVSVRLWHGGYVAALLCVVVYLALLALVLAWRYRRGAWRHIDLTGESPLALEAMPPS